MRRHAAVRSATGLTPSDHLAWGYQDRSEFLTRAAEYIADGVRRQQYIAYAGEGSRTALEAELAAMPGIGRCLDSGAVQVMPADEYYPYQFGSDVINAESAVAQYVAATERVIDNGYIGYRVVSDVTSVARTIEQRDALARLEYLVDQKMAVHPFSALCGYDTAELGAGAAELICLHPFVNKGSVAFQLYAEPDGGMHFSLTGEIDGVSDELFATTLNRIWPLVSGDTLRIDAQELEFIGHRQLYLLEEHAREHNREVVLRTSQPIPGRLVDLLDLTAVRVQPAVG